MQSKVADLESGAAEAEKAHEEALTNLAGERDKTVAAAKADAQKEIDALQENEVRLKKQLEEATQKLTSLEDTHKGALNGALEDATAAREAAKRAESETECKLADLKAVHDREMALHRERYQEELGNVHKKEDDYELRIAELSTEVDKLRAAAEQGTEAAEATSALQEQLAENESKLAEALSKNASAEEKLVAASEAQGKADELLAKATDEQKRLEDEVAALQQRLESATTRIGDLEAQQPVSSEALMSVSPDRLQEQDAELQSIREQREALLKEVADLREKAKGSSAPPAVAPPTPTASESGSVNILQENADDIGENKPQQPERPLPDVSLAPFLHEAAARCGRCREHRFGNAARFPRGGAGRRE